MAHEDFVQMIGFPEIERRQQQYCPTPRSSETPMGSTITEKIMARAGRLERVGAGENHPFPPDYMIAYDYPATPTSCSVR